MSGFDAAATRSQYEELVSAPVRDYAEILMAAWRDDGRDDQRIEAALRASVLFAYSSGLRDGPKLRTEAREPASSS